jgi:N-acetyl-alpha-D-glucosaminyl L-malate synthase BshA
VKPLSLGIACFPTVGGSGVVASQLGAKLAGRGHTVHVFSSGVPARLGHGREHCHLHRVDPVLRPPVEHGAYALTLAGALAEVTLRERLDVLHVHYAIPHAASALLARQIVEASGGRRPQVVTTLHGTDVTSLADDPALRLVTRHATLQSDLITTPSQSLRRNALETMQLPADTRIEVVPNFVDPGEFRPSPDRASLSRLFPRFEWSGPARPSVLLHASNFRALKRVGDAVVALSEVIRERPAVLVLVGDGPEREGVEKLAGALGLGPYVTFLGEQLHLGGLFAQADVFVLPSEQESFGLAALEALASGVPVVASNVGGLPEVVRDGETGRLVPPHDPRALAEAVLDLLRDEPRRAEMGRAARADATARFRPEPVLDRFEALYRELLVRRP